MKPLVLAYETKIKSLEKALESNLQEVQRFEKQSDNYIKQNEILRKKLDEKCQ